MRARVGLLLGVVSIVAAMTVTPSANADPVGAAITLFEDTWGSFGTSDGQFSNPRGVAANEFGEVYVADTGNDRIVQLDAAGRFLRAWGTPGTGNGQFNAPWDVDVDNNEKVYVIDSGNNRVQVFTRTGQFIRTWGSEGGRSGRFRGPKGITVASDLTVFVADTGNDRIQSFDFAGNHLVSFGGTGSGNGQLRGPRDVTANINNEVFVADTGNDRVQEFDGSGVFRRKWGSFGTGNRKFDAPQGIYTQGNAHVTENIFVADTGNNRIVSYARGGTYETKWGSTGAGNGQFDGPRNVFVGLDDRRYVVETGNDRVQKFRPETTQGLAGDVSGINGNQPEGRLGNIFVIATDATTFRLVAGARTDVNGDWNMDVPVGTYDVAYFDPTGRHRYEYWDDEPDISTADDLVVPPDAEVAPSGVVLTETPVTGVSQPGTIAGDVTDDAGPVAGAWVMAVDSSGLPTLTTIADATGHYEIPGLETGEYLLIFMDPSGTNATEFFDDSAGPDGADPVAVTFNNTTVADAHLDP